MEVNFSTPRPLRSAPEIATRMSRNGLVKLTKAAHHAKKTSLKIKKQTQSTPLTTKKLVYDYI